MVHHYIDEDPQEAREDARRDRAELERLRAENTAIRAELVKLKPPAVMSRPLPHGWTWGVDCRGSVYASPATDPHYRLTQGSAPHERVTVHMRVSSLLSELRECENKLAALDAVIAAFAAESD
jgi:hypothetical protein